MAPRVMDASSIMEGCCCPPQIGSPVLKEGTVKGFSVSMPGRDVLVLVATLGGGWALPCKRTGTRIPWLSGECQSCGGLLGGNGHKTCCLLCIGETGGGDWGGGVVSSRGAVVGTGVDGNATSCVVLAVRYKKGVRADR